MDEVNVGFLVGDMVVGCNVADNVTTLGVVVVSIGVGCIIGVVVGLCVELDVGTLVGLIIGGVIGDSDGGLVIADVGDVVGNNVGDKDDFTGMADGFEVARLVGNCEGLNVVGGMIGDIVGGLVMIIGEIVGCALGVFVGGKVGGCVGGLVMIIGEIVGCVIGIFVGGKVGGCVRRKVGISVSIGVGFVVGDAKRGKIRIAK